MLRNLLGAARRFVLVIGNGGALLADVAGGRIGKSWAISDFEDHSLAVIAQALERNRRVPLVVLIDMLEQSYRREAIPPVNVFDRPKVLTRRLGITFPSFDIRAALPLGEVVGQRGDLAYLFVALPSSPELETWIAFLHGIDNPVTSLGLMPIESVGLAAALARAVTGEDDPPVDWTLLISRERTGGIRQIVVRGDKLSITRLTPAPVAASTPADIALAISPFTRFGGSHESESRETSGAGPNEPGGRYSASSVSLSSNIRLPRLLFMEAKLGRRLNRSELSAPDSSM